MSRNFAAQVKAHFVRRRMSPMECQVFHGSDGCNTSRKISEPANQGNHPVWGPLLERLCEGRHTVRAGFDACEFT